MRPRRNRRIRATAIGAATALIASFIAIVASIGTASAVPATITISGDAAPRNSEPAPDGGAWTFGGGYFADFTTLATTGSFGEATFEVAAPIASPTPAALAGVEVYISSAVEGGYTADEKAALLNFVQGGGVLIALSNQAAYNVTDFLGESAGAPVTLGPDVAAGGAASADNIVANTSVLPDRPPTITLSPTYTNFVDSSLPGEAVRLYTLGGNPVAAAIPFGTAQFGQGAVIMGSDSDIFAGCPDSDADCLAAPLGADNAAFATEVLEYIGAHFTAGTTPPPGPGPGTPPLEPGFCRASLNPPANPSPASALGYWFLGRDGGVFSFGDVDFHGSLPGIGVTTPAAAMSSRADGAGYWVVDENGIVHGFGASQFHGDMRGVTLNSPIIGLEPTPSGNGYWLLAGDGGVFSFGDADFLGSTGNLRLNAPVISMRAHPSGQGYWLLASDGGVFTFGNAAFHGSTGSMVLNAPVISMAVHPAGGGYWLLGADGGVFSFGAVQFEGSVPGIGLCANPTAVQIRSTASGNGYWLLGTDGGVFSFGDAFFFGSFPNLSGNSRAVDMSIRY